MKLSHLHNLAARAYHFVGQKTGLTSWARAWLSGNEGQADGPRVTNPLTQVTWIYAAVMAKAEKIGQVPLRAVASATRDEPLTAGPVVELLNRPHPMLDATAWRELLAMWLDLRGEFFIVALDKSRGILPLNRPNLAGRIASLEILKPDNLTEVTANGELQGWRYQTSGTEDNFRTMALLPEEVLHVRRPNPHHAWRGLSPLTVARIAYETDHNAAIFMKGLLANNGDTGVIVTTEQILSPEQQEQIKAALRERKRAAGTADRPLLLHGGMKLEKPTLAAADMQFLENRKFSRQELLAIFRVPDSILGFTEDANRSVSEQQAADWINNVIAPLGGRITAGLSRLLAPAVCYFDFDMLPEMRAAWRARVDTAVKLIGIGVPLNDANEALDLGLPEYPWGETGCLPYSLQPAMNIVEPPPEPPAPKSPLQPPSSKIQAPRHVCAPADPSWEAKLKAEARLTKSKLTRFFFEQRSRLLKRLAEQIGNGKAIKADFEIDWEALFAFAQENKALKTLLKARAIATFTAGAKDLLAEVNMVDFTLKPEAAIAFFEKRANMIESITQDKFNQIKTTLQEGLGNGDSWEQLADRVKTEYSSFTDYQAERIAQTETNTALNSGRAEAMIETGVQLKAWKASKLENVRASHKDAEERSLKGIPMDQPFSNGLMHPGDPEGPPDEVINCRCFMIPIIPGRES